MLDSDLAAIYGVETRVFNQSVKRNSERFPDEFRFQLTKEEYESLRSQSVTLKTDQRGKHRKYLPFVFTEQGVAMLSAVLRSETAVAISIQIMQAFVAMRHFVQDNALLFSNREAFEATVIKPKGRQLRIPRIYFERHLYLPRSGIPPHFANQLRGSEEEQRCGHYGAR